MIGLIGLNHKTAPIAIREQYSFSNEEIEQFYKLLQIEPGLKGVVVLSTCNRTEIYFQIDKCCRVNGMDFIFRNLSFFKNYKQEHFEYFYKKEGIETVNHLFHVVSGLDSLVIGEDQIIGQVKNAFRLSLDKDSAGKVLTRMFNKAFEAGKRVRTETSINQGSGSVSSAAFDLCKQRFPDYTRKNILLVGAGETGTLAITNFAKRNCKNISITNRTFEKAEKLAQRCKGRAFEIENLSNELLNADILIVATGSKKHLVTKPMAELLTDENPKKRLYIDLSVPRNIDAEIANLKNIELVSVDDLQEIVKNTSSKRQQSVKDAEEIISSVIQEFVDWLHSLDLKPTILKIKDNFENLNASELEGFLKINSVKDSKEVSEYAQHITQKYFRLLVRNLKTVSENGKNKDVVKLVNKLFELT